MRCFLKTKAVAYFGNIPVGMLKERFCLCYEAFGNKNRGRFSCGALYGAVKMVNVYGQGFRKITC